MPGLKPADTMQNSVARLRYQMNTFINNEADCQKCYMALDAYRRDGDLAKFVNVLKEVLNRPERMRVYDIMRPCIALPQQMEYNMLIPYARSKVRMVRLKRPTGLASYGFAIRGGREHGIGVFVSQVDEESEAHVHGLKVGDQIIQVNGLKIDEAIHEEVLNLLKTGTILELKVKSVGMIPVKSTISNGSNPMEELGNGNSLPDASDSSSTSVEIRTRKLAVTTLPPVTDPSEPIYSQRISTPTDLDLNSRKISAISTRSRSDTLSWQVVDIDSPTSPLTKTFSSNSSRSGDIQEVTVYLTVPPNQRFGCNICKGPSERPGIFIQSIREGGLACEVGLRAGDQIMEANGKDLLTMEFMEAVSYLKNSKAVELLIRKGAGVELFPNDTSGYNSSNSSVNEEPVTPKPIQVTPKQIQVTPPPVIEPTPRTCVEDKETGELDCEERTEEKNAGAAEVAVVAATVEKSAFVASVDTIKEDAETEVAPPVVEATVVVINPEPVYAKVDSERKKSNETDREARRRQVEFRARQHREEERQVVLASMQTAAMTQVVDVDVLSSTPTRIPSWQDEDDEAERLRQLEYTTKMEEQHLGEEVEEMLAKAGARGRRPSLLYASMAEMKQEAAMDRTEKLVRIAEAQVERNISRSSSSSSGGSSTVVVAPALEPIPGVADKWQKTVLAEIHNTPKPSVGLGEQSGRSTVQIIPMNTTQTPTPNNVPIDSVRKISCEPTIPVNAEIQKRNQHALQERDRLGIGASAPTAAPTKYRKKVQPVQVNPVILSRASGWIQPTTPTPMSNYSGDRKNSLVPIIPPNMAPHKFLDPSPQIYGFADSPIKESAQDTIDGPGKKSDAINNNHIPRTPLPMSNAAPDINFNAVANRNITDSAQAVPKPPEYFFKPKPKVNVIVGSYADLITKSGPNRLEYLKSHPSVEIEMLKTEVPAKTTPVPTIATKTLVPPTATNVTTATKTPAAVTKSPATVTVVTASIKPTATPPKVTPPVVKSVTKVTLNQSPPVAVEDNTRPISPTSSSAFQEVRARFGAQLRPVTGNGTAAASQQPEVTGASRRQRPPVSTDSRVQIPPERVIVIE